MKVEFNAEEVWQMMDNVVDQMLMLDISAKERATIRRWRDDEMALGAPAMQLLAEKVNSELQRTHGRSETVPIVKPDWAR